MRVAIDARPLSHDLTGIGRYTLNIVKALIKNHKDIDWFLFSDRPLCMNFDKQPNLTIITGNCNKKFTSTFFSQYYYPIWCKNFNIDLFWSPRHHLPLGLIFNKKIKKIVTIHDIVWKKHPKTMSKFGLVLEKLLFLPSIEISNKIISVSHFTKTELINNFNVEADKITVTNLQSFLPAQKNNKLKKQPTTKYLLFVGTLEPRKNLHNLLIAFKTFVLHHSNYELKIVGKKGWGGINIQDIVNKLNITKNVKLEGFVTDEQLVKLYENCEILMMPSLYEGFGLPALEALSFNKKVIVNRLNAIVEIPGDNIYITETTPEAITKTINTAIVDTPKNIATVGSDWSIVAMQTYKTIKAELI